MPTTSPKSISCRFTCAQRSTTLSAGNRGISPDIEQSLLRLLRVKPRRTASGVATISVITKPWPCTNNCLYCPNDLRMPKSYVADEPACQRAERNWFDPYLQVAARLRALREMGHVTDKVELIILGGTWNDYPSAYQRWFVRELFRALNEAADPAQSCASAAERKTVYEQARLPRSEDDCAARVAAAQALVNSHDLTYNEAFPQLYGEQTAWHDLASWQTATWEDVEREHVLNEKAKHRVVGLVMETRPDAVSAQSFRDMRRLGATKVQMGIQSLNTAVLAANRRNVSPNTIRRAFELARLFGFKTHAHFMVNLLQATPETDKQDYLELLNDSALAPDEVKLYPCALIEGTDLVPCRWEMAPLHRRRADGRAVSRLAGNACLLPRFAHDSRYSGQRHPHGQQKDQPAPNGRSGNRAPCR